MMSTHKNPHQRIRLGHPNYGTEGRHLLQWPLVLGGPSWVQVRKLKREKD